MARARALIGQRVYLDTNIVIYAIEGHPPLDAPIGDLFDLLQSGQVTGFLSRLTLAEALVLPLRNADDARARAYLDLFASGRLATARFDTEPVVLTAASLRARSRLMLADALHLATAIEAGCDLFLTNDLRLAGKAAIDVATLEP